MFTASATEYASGYNAYGSLVTSIGTATATSNISDEDALLTATLLAQNIAASQLQHDVNIIDQSVDIAKGNCRFTQNNWLIHIITYYV